MTGQNGQAADAGLRALEGLGVYDGAPEERFDRITTLAKNLLDVSAAVITLVGRDRQWYKSAQGTSLLPIPSSDGLFDYPVRTHRPLVVEDLWADPRFAENRFVVGAPHVRCFAGYPLSTAGGHVVGALCVLDPEPRRFAEADRTALDELAGWTQNELNRSAELDRAAEVQRGLLPRLDRLTVSGYELAAACLPSRTVGGDLVDYYFAPDGDLVITLGDVMGKGIGAAIMMATVRAAMRAAGRQDAPAAAVQAGAAALDEDLRKTNTLVTLCHVRLSPTTGRFRYTDAGHGLLLVIRDGEIMPGPGAGGLPLGVSPNEGWPEVGGELLPGDTLVAFSDGLLDLYPDVATAFDGVRRVVAEGRATGDVVEHFESVARRHPLADDVTLFVLRRTAG